MEEISRIVSQQRSRPASAEATCWICLDGDGDLDDGGQPIVRDCSCRGEDAGFVHLPCLVQYAERKTTQLVETNAEGDRTAPWEICPYCRREYQGYLALYMAKALMNYMDEKHPGVDIIKVKPLMTMLKRIFCMEYEASRELREIGRGAANEILSLIQDSDTDGMPHVAGHQMHVYGFLAKFAEAEGDLESSMHYQRQVADLARSRGDDEHALRVERIMELMQSAREGGTKPSLSEQELKDKRRNYEKLVKVRGEDDSTMIVVGLNLAYAWHYSGHHGLECERLASRMYAISRRVHGPDHDMTRQIQSLLLLARKRQIAKGKGDGAVMYEVLRISDNGKYVAKIAKSSDEEKVEEIGIEGDCMIVPGTPVVCHGLKNAAHLNGKLGDVRSFDDDSGRYAVRFEDKRLKTVLVKPSNLRIVFELPDGV